MAEINICVEAQENTGRFQPSRPQLPPRAGGRCCPRLNGSRGWRSKSLWGRYGTAEAAVGLEWSEGQGTKPRTTAWF